jgi:excisionase family DNA binding protein
VELGELLTINQAATEVGVSRRTIYNWMRYSKIQFVRTAGGNVRIIKDSLWQASGKVDEKPRTDNN